MQEDPTDETAQRKGGGCLLAFALCCLVVVGCVFWWLSGRRFDSARWKASTGGDESKLAMVDDLLARYELVGMSQVEINDLLGVPPETAYFSRYNYVYWLGDERSFYSIDSEWLAIRFVDGVVVEADLVRD